MADEQPKPKAEPAPPTPAQILQRTLAWPLNVAESFVERLAPEEVETMTAAAGTAPIDESLKAWLSARADRIREQETGDREQPAIP